MRPAVALVTLLAALAVAGPTLGGEVPTAQAQETPTTLDGDRSGGGGFDAGMVALVVAIVGAAIAGLTYRVTRRQARGTRERERDALERWVKDRYAVRRAIRAPAASAPKTSSEASLFLLGEAPDVTPLGFAASRYAGERALLRRILSRIDGADAPFTHLAVVGGARQGTSTFLAQLAVRLERNSRRLRALVLYHNGHDRLGSLDWSQIRRYWDMDRGDRARRLLGRRPRRLFVVFDEFPEADQQDRPAVFLHDAESEGVNGGRVVLVTGSSRPILGARSERFDLRLEPDDEESLLEVVKRAWGRDPQDPPTVDEARGRFGGVRRYGGDVEAFMMQAIAAVAEPDLARIVVEDDPAVADAARVAAACQLLDMELPVALLEQLLPGGPEPRELRERLRPWLSYPVEASYLDDVAEPVSSVSMRAASIAEPMLKAVEVRGYDDLRDLYLRIVSAALARDPRRESAIYGEFVRTLFYRLGKGRHFRFAEEPEGGEAVGDADGSPTVMSRVLARDLFETVRDDLVEYVERCRDRKDVEGLCTWAQLFRRLGDVRLTRDACEAAVDIGAGGPPLSARATVTLLTAVNALHDPGLMEAALTLVDFDAALDRVDAATAGASADERHQRLSQFLHAYARALNNYGKAGTARRALDDFERRGHQLGSLGWLLRGSLSKNKAVKARAWGEARRMALEVESRREPWTLVEVDRRYIDSVSMSKATDREKYVATVLGLVEEAEQHREREPQRYRDLLVTCAVALDRTRAEARRVPGGRSGVELADETFRRGLALESRLSGFEVHVDTRVQYAAFLSRRYRELGKRYNAAMVEAEQHLLTARNASYLGDEERSAACLALAEHIGKRRYRSSRGKRPQFTEARHLAEAAFIDPEVFTGDAPCTFLPDCDALAVLAELWEGRAIADRDLGTLRKSKAFSQRGLRAFSEGRLGGRGSKRTLKRLRDAYFTTVLGAVWLRHDEVLERWLHEYCSLTSHDMGRAVEGLGRRFAERAKRERHLQEDQEGRTEAVARAILELAREELKAEPCSRSVPVAIRSLANVHVKHRHDPAAWQSTYLDAYRALRDAIEVCPRNREAVDAAVTVGPELPRDEYDPMSEERSVAAEAAEELTWLADPDVLGTVLDARWHRRNRFAKLVRTYT